MAVLVVPVRLRQWLGRYERRRLRTPAARPQTATTRDPYRSQAPNLQSNARGPGISRPCLQCLASEPMAPAASVPCGPASSRHPLQFPPPLVPIWTRNLQHETGILPQNSQPGSREVTELELTHMTSHGIAKSPRVVTSSWPESTVSTVSRDQRLGSVQIRFMLAWIVRACPASHIAHRDEPRPSTDRLCLVRSQCARSGCRWRCHQCDAPGSGTKSNH